MHYEILIEDKSGEKSMTILAPKLLRENDTFKIHSYKGIGHIPKGLKPKMNSYLFLMVSWIYANQNQILFFALPLRSLKHGILVI